MIGRYVELRRSDGFRWGDLVYEGKFAGCVDWFGCLVCAAGCVFGKLCIVVGRGGLELLAW